MKLSLPKPLGRICVEDVDPFYKIERPEAEEDRDVNRYARTNAGGALWEATYQALRDEGRSHAQAEAFCNSKFFDHYYEALIEGLRRPMRKVLKDIRRANRKAGRDFDKKYLIDEFIFDNQVFNAHEGGHLKTFITNPIPTRFDLLDHRARGQLLPLDHVDRIADLIRDHVLHVVRFR